MSRRVTLPGADELFRQTTTLAAVPNPAPSPIEEPENVIAEGIAPTPEKKKNVRTTSRRRVNAFDRSPSGRERHDEKITVYLSPEELYDIDQARLALRGDLGLAVDRGRIVREAVSIIIADLENKGEQSILVRRLRGRA
jgi:hypothetical protein